VTQRVSPSITQNTCLFFIFFLLLLLLLSPTRHLCLSDIPCPAKPLNEYQLGFYFLLGNLALLCAMLVLQLFRQQQGGGTGAGQGEEKESKFITSSLATYSLPFPTNLLYLALQRPSCLLSSEASHGAAIWGTSPSA
jgi:hypothetical protein